MAETWDVVTEHVLEFLWTLSESALKYVAELSSELRKRFPFDLNVIWIQLHEAFVDKHVNISKVEAEALELGWIIEVLQRENLRL